MAIPEDPVEEIPFEELASAKRAYRAATADERMTLDAFLDLYRDILVRKVSGLTDDQARQRLVDSHTTLAGLVKHMRVIEMNWFQRILAQTPDSELPTLVAWDRPESTFILEPHDTTASLVEAYQQQCTTSRQIALDHRLEDTVPHSELGQVSLRWIYIHMIDETARHVGHADILREQTDGKIGS